MKGFSFNYMHSNLDGEFQLRATSCGVPQLFKKVINSRAIPASRSYERWSFCEVRTTREICIYVSRR